MTRTEAPGSAGPTSPPGSAGPTSPPGSAGPSSPPGSAGPSSPPGDNSSARTLTELSGVLVKALRGLGAAGRPVAASRLAAQAWWVLRDEWPRQAERINGTMHYLARLPDEDDGASDGDKYDGDETDRGGQDDPAERKDIA